MSVDNVRPSEGEIIADLRRTYSQLRANPTDPRYAAWSLRLTVEELTTLLAIVDERDELRRQGVGDYESGFFPVEARIASHAVGDAPLTPEMPPLSDEGQAAAISGCPFADTIHDCPLGGCPDASPREVQIPDLPGDDDRVTTESALVGATLLSETLSKLGREERETPPRPCPGVSSALSVGGSRRCEREAGHEGACSRDGWSWAAPRPTA